MGRRDGALTIFFFLYCLLCWGQRDFLLHWWSVWIGEGSFLHAASRIAAGESPYRDFTFPYSPGALVLFSGGILQGISPRFISIVSAAATSTLVLRWALSQIGALNSFFLALVLVLWGFPLENAAGPTWPALFFAVLGLFYFHPRNTPLTAICVLCATLIYPPIGLGASVGLFVAARARWPWWAVAILLGMGICLAPNFLGHAIPGKGLFDFPKAVREIYLIQGALFVFGFWCLSLYLVRLGRVAALFFGAAVAGMVFYFLWKEGPGFFWATAVIFAASAYLFFPLLAKEEGKGGEVFAIWVSAVSITLAVAPAWRVENILYLWPLHALVIFCSMTWLRRKYPHISAAWAFAPVGIILVGGMLHLGTIRFFTFYGEKDQWGQRPVGAAAGRSNEALFQLKTTLVAAGQRVGDPLLMLPIVPGFYYFTGYRNPRPETLDRSCGAGDAKGSTLSGYLAAGGRFAVTDESCPIDVLLRVQERFSLVKKMNRFSLWEKKAN